MTKCKGCPRRQCSPYASLCIIVPGIVSQSNVSCQGLQHTCDRYPVLSEHARTMLHFMWQADLYGVAKSVTYCLGAYLTPGGVQASDQP